MLYLCLGPRWWNPKLGTLKNKSQMKSGLLSLGFPRNKPFAVISKPSSKTLSSLLYLAVCSKEWIATIYILLPCIYSASFILWSPVFFSEIHPVITISNLSIICCSFYLLADGWEAAKQARRQWWNKEPHKARRVVDLTVAKYYLCFVDMFYNL